MNRAEKKQARQQEAKKTATGANPERIPSSCSVCESRSKGLFCEATEDSLDKIRTTRIFRKVAPGDSVFRAGDDPDGLYCLKRGTVKIESIAESGQSHILYIVNEGGILGLRAVLENEPFEANAVALQETDVCFIPRSDFEALLKTDPGVALRALRTVSSELHDMEKRFCHATDLTASERIAEALLHLKDRFEFQQWSRREFAEWASTTTETVIRTLAQFEKEGLIELDGRRIRILDRKGLLSKAKIYI